MFIAGGGYVLIGKAAEFCRRERKIMKAHYMLAYECELRRLFFRGPRRISNSWGERRVMRSVIGATG